MKKLIALILLLSILVCTFTGCERILELLQNTNTEEPGYLAGELTQQMVDDFYALLQQTENFCLSTEDVAAADEKIEELDAAYLEIVDQYQIAYINYCLDQTNETQKQCYLHCVDTVAEVEAAYNDMCKRIYLAETAIRDELFADWSQAEIDRMLKHNEEIKQLEKRNSEITVEYRELEEDEAWSENMVTLYNELVKNNNRIAEIYGYENYYAFAYKMVYDRDYEGTEIRQMREYVAMYLPDAFDASLLNMQDLYSTLKVKDQLLVDSLMFDPYDELSENYVTAYIASAPETVQNGMRDMFTKERVVFTDSPNAYEGAFTTWIDGTPFCFYGPNYDNSMTVVHELGHYYGCSYVDAWSQPMDLSETQSQSNEWLFIRFLRDQISEEAYQVMVEYAMLENIGNIICFSMIDEFEQQVYASDRAGEMTVSEYEALMAEIAEPYGGIDYICEEIMDIQLYWKYVVLESPVYYISYAVSGVAAVDLFSVAEENLEEAFAVYVRLIEEPQEDQGFLGNIQYAGLAGPFEETVYQRLYKRYIN